MNKTGKEIKVLQFGKEEIRLSLLADSMIFYVENASESTKNSWNQLVNMASLLEAGLQQLHPGERQGVRNK